MNNLAVISVIALALAILVSCVTTLNVGVLAIAMAWSVGVYIGNIPLNTVIAGFPDGRRRTSRGCLTAFDDPRIVHRRASRRQPPAVQT